MVVEFFWIFLIGESLKVDEIDGRNKTSQLRVGQACLYLFDIYLFIYLFINYLFRQCQNKLLREEISSKHARIRVLSSETSLAYSEVAGLVFTIHFIHLKTLSDQENSKKFDHYQLIIRYLH